ncbi:MAG: phosphoribosyl-AMP cyclohydrolase [Hyphomicrobiaceae bacterium]
MTSPTFRPFASQQDRTEVEEGHSFQPKFDASGLIPAIVTDVHNGQVLMFAWMNDVALDMTLCSGEAHFWSRSRRKIWRKGEESGNVLAVQRIRTDCDQDVIWLTAEVLGDGIACHTNRVSCFYRWLDVDRKAHRIELKRDVDGSIEDTSPQSSRNR